MDEKEHSLIRKFQIAKSEQYANAKPSEVTDIYWIYAHRTKGDYPKSTLNSGKWLVFVNSDNIDDVWKDIKTATESGLLGKASKVATNKPNPNATNSNVKVICVYSYDYTDEQDVMRIRRELRKIGIESKIPYKTDRATQENKYVVKGSKRTSVYYE